MALTYIRRQSHHMLITSILRFVAVEICRSSGAKSDYYWRCSTNMSRLRRWGSAIANNWAQMFCLLSKHHSPAGTRAILGRKPAVEMAGYFRAQVPGPPAQAITSRAFSPWFSSGCIPAFYTLIKRHSPAGMVFVPKAVTGIGWPDRIADCPGNWPGLLPSPSPNPNWNPG
jgi:hypothetical protein